MRKRNHYLVAMTDRAPHKTSRREFYARLSVGAIYRPDPVRKPKYARASPGYRVWVEDGVLRVLHWFPWAYWRAMAAARMRTNAQMIEQLAVMAIWTPCPDNLTRQREAALQYAD